MDNLTHSLVGALIGQMGLKRKTGLAMPTLIIAANLPDIDALATLLGGHQHLAIRRGITHGPVAMVLLPLMLWAAMRWFDRWQTLRGTRPEKRLPVDAKWLLALAYIGCLSHPLFDWFNSYGIRLLEPFSSQWFYGDTIFIIDIWLWIALIAGIWISLRRERKGATNWRIPAFASLAAISAYIFVNGLITWRAEHKAGVAIIPIVGAARSLVVANPVPVQFWKREMLWRGGVRFGDGMYNAAGDAFAVGKISTSTNKFPESRAIEVAEAYPDARAYLFWSRMPVYNINGEGDGRKLVISDQRFGNELVRDRFVVSIPWKATD